MFLTVVLTLLLGNIHINRAYADDSTSSADNSSRIQVVAKYSMSNVDPQTLSKIESIANSDSNVSVSTSHGVLEVDELSPIDDDATVNGPAKASSLSVTASSLSATPSTVKTVNFNDYVGHMDQENGISNASNGTPVSSDGNLEISLIGKSYNGQTYSGEHVSTGTHVHCNRFNGSNSDHTYWGKFNPRVWIDFYHSDCDYHGPAYKCYTMPFGSSGQCDGLNGKGHGVKDCSSWSGGPKHKNWRKTAWYRN